MPLYYDPGYGYYGAGGYSSYTPYYITNSYSLYSPSSTSSYNRPMTSNYLHTTKRSNLASSRYKPKLSTICETPLSSYHHSSLTPLTRIQSPKISPYRSSPKYIAPKPIPINTADIDVSATKYQSRRRSSIDNERNSTKRSKANEESRSNSVKSQKSTSDDSIILEPDDKNTTTRSPFMPRVDGTDPGNIRPTIKRDRRVVRLSTVRSRPKPVDEIELQKPENAQHSETPLWCSQTIDSQFFQEKNENEKRNSEKLFLEPVILPLDKNLEDAHSSKQDIKSPPFSADSVEILDPMAVRRLSLTVCPSFHEICEDISSDKIDDDLNAGELRRRASIIQEQEIEILNQLQKSESGTFHCILERNETQDDCRKSVKRKSSKKGKKVRHKLTATVNVENPRLVAILQEDPEEIASLIQPKISYEVEEIKEEHTVHKIFKLPKKKQKTNKTGSKKQDDNKKEKSTKDTKVVKECKVADSNIALSPKSLLYSKPSTGPEHFTFDFNTTEEFKNEKDEKSPIESPKKIITLKKVDSKSNSEHFQKPLPSSSVIENFPKTSLIQTLNNKKLSQVPKSSETYDLKSPQTPKTFSILKALSKVDSADSGFGELKSTSSPMEADNFAKPKPITKLQKSESSEDFWGQIGTRETLYMSQRKKQLLEQQFKEFSQNQENENSFVIKNDDGCKRSESNDSVFSKNQTKSTASKNNLHETNNIDDKISNVKNKNESLQTANSAATEININKFSDLQHKLEKGSHQTKKTEKSLTPATSPTASITDSTNISQTKIDSGRMAKTPELKNKQIKKDNQIPSLENEITLKPNEELNQNEIDKSARNAVGKNTNKIPTDTMKVPITMKITSTTVKDNVICADQAKETEVKSPPPTSTNVSAILATKSTTSTAISDNSIKNQTKNEKDDIDKIRTNKIGSPKETSTNLTGSLKNSTKRLNNQKTTFKKSLTNVNDKNDKELNKIQSPSPQQSSQTQENKKSEKSVTVKPTPIATSNQKLFEKTENITIVNEDNKKQPTVGTHSHDNDVNSKPATTQSINTEVATELSRSFVTTSIKESSNSQSTHILGAKDDQNKLQQSPPTLSKFATVSNLNRCLLDVDAELSDFYPSEPEQENSSSYEEDSSCEEIDENGMKKKNKHGKKKEKDKTPVFNPNKVVKLDHTKKCYVKDEKPPYPLIAKPRPLWKPEKHVYNKSDSESESDESESDSECSSSDEYSDELNPSNNGITSLRSDVRMSTCSNDSGFEGGTAPSSPKKMLECDINCHKKCEKLTANLCGVNQKLMVEALSSVKRGVHDARDSPSTPPSHNPAYKIDQNHDDVDDLETSYTFAQFQRSGHITAPATIIPRFKKYSVEDFHFLAVLGKGSFGKVLLAELRNTEYYYAVKCLKKDVVLQDDDVECTLIERKVLALGTKHPYLCHLFCTFQTESHLFFVMEYLNGGDLMFHIQQSGRFPEPRARFYGAEIISGLKFLHKKGIIYRDLKLDNVLLDFDGHVRIADFGMCKLQVYLDRTADTFCGTPDYMAPEIIKGEKYNQNVDWWSFGVLLYEMLIGQSPFSGCDEDELFWSICNELPWFPVFLSKEATSILKGLLEKDANCRVGSQYSPAGDICGHIFFQEIDWYRLERRELEPPFKPQVKHPLDTQYFDKAFTRERVRLTPIDKEILQSMDQEQFQGFSYTNPNATLN